MRIRPLVMPVPQSATTILRSASSLTGVSAAASYASGLALDLDARCVYDATDVTTWPDRSSSGHDATSIAAHHPTVGATWSDGGPAVTFDGATQWFNVDAAATVAATQVFTIACLFRTATASGATQTLFGFGGAGATPLASLFLETTADGVSLFLRNAGGTVTKILTDSDALTTLDYFVVAVFNGAASAVYLNGIKTILDLSGVTPVGTFTHAMVGALPVSGSPTNVFAGQMRHVALWSRALGDTDVLAVAMAWGAEDALAYRVILDGASITLGTYRAVELSTLLSLPARALVSNIAANSHTVAQRRAQFDTLVLPYVSPTLPLVYFAGGDMVSNSIYFGLTATAAVAEYFALLDYARSVGCIVVAQPPITRGEWVLGGTWDNATGEAQRVLAATAILAGWQAHADTLSDPTIAEPLTDFTDTTYFDGDMTHPVEAGERVLASTVQPALLDAAGLALRTMLLTA